MSHAQKMELVERENPDISILRQCVLLGVHRSGLYRDHPSEEAATNLELMRLIDQQYLDMPCYGSRKMTAWLRQEGYDINFKEGSKVNAVDGHRGHLPEAKHQQAPS